LKKDLEKKIKQGRFCGKDLAGLDRGIERFIIRAFASMDD
jgi:hypothetical protein